MAVTIEMIETKEFKVIARGYDPKEVDEFLDDIMDEMARQLDEIQSLQQQLATAKAAPAATQAVRPVQASPYAAPKAAPAAEVPDKAFREILEMAQKVKDETIAKAESDAAEIRAKAQEQADAQLKNLDDEKERLTQQVTDLRAAAADYRSRFEALLQAQQEAIEKASNLF